jgi:DNA-binding transcriptional LysR family regulator
MPASSAPGQSGGETWVFGHPLGASTSVRVSARIEVAAAEGVTACVRAGFGIALASRWMCARELAAGEVVSLLHGFSLAPAELYALLPAGRRSSHRASAFADHLARSFRTDGSNGDWPRLRVGSTPGP